jgi:serine/threonine-protein kinase
VTAQAPTPGTKLVSGAEVRINVSKGPKPIGVPSVIGLLYDTAASQLQAAGFAVARVDVDNDQPAGVVVDQVPAGNSTASKGSTVTLSVSNGPTTTPLPDVAGQTVADARATLTAAGFKASVTLQDTDQQVYDGIVITQEPPGNTQQDPETIVTLFVGRYVPPPDTTPTDTTATTPTDTTATTPAP